MQQRTGGKLSGTQTVACAGLAGGLAGMIGNPTEVKGLCEQSKRTTDIGRLFW